MFMRGNVLQPELNESTLAGNVLATSFQGNSF